MALEDSLGFAKCSFDHQDQEHQDILRAQKAAMRMLVHCKLVCAMSRRLKVPIRVKELRSQEVTRKR